MNSRINAIERPSKEEQKTALASYDALAAVLEQLKVSNPEIEIAETQERIKVPISALKLLVSILKELSKGNPVSILPLASEVTTQVAAELIGCSRPHVIKLLEEGEIPFNKIGRHRRIKMEDIVAYKQKMKEKQKALLIELMKEDEESGMYDT